MNHRQQAGIAHVAELVLVRHGESVGNLAASSAAEQGLARLELSYRDPDTPLSDNGVAQARALGRHLAQLPASRHPDVVLSSPYERAARTMRHAVAAWSPGLTPLYDERLRERDLGLFDGMTGHGIREAHPEEARRREAMGKFYYRPPGGESWTDVVLRVRSLVTDVVALHPERRVWIFTHQAVIMAFRYVLESLSEADILRVDGETPLGNCSITRYRPGHDGALELVSYGSVDHLEPSDAVATHEPPHAPTHPGDRDG